MLIKQKIVGTNIGRILFYFRDKLDLFSAALFKLEALGTIANDQLATKLVTSLCLPNKTFIDVGAHIGSIISEVNFNDQSIKIIAIEAIPEKVQVLRRKFPTVLIYECAAGESRGITSFYVNTRQSGYSSLYKQANTELMALKEISVKLDLLDNIIDSYNVDVIKIDVEGAELGVLKGSEQLISRCHPTIMFESAPNKDIDSGYAKKDIFSFFSKHNYVLLTPNRVAHNDRGLSEEEFIRGHLYPRVTTNYFAISSTRREEIKERARKLLGIC